MKGKLLKTKETEVRKGTKIDTIYGYLIITDYNDVGLYSANGYWVDENGECKESYGTLILTASDIERRMKEVDGYNHKIKWVG